MDKVPKNIKLRRLIGMAPMIAWAISVNVESKTLKGIIFFIGFLIFVIGISYSFKEK